ncbi:internalin [Bifidobacterium margollesii]|uniref:Internalin n=2 Tax=Bifidobacterium margollesii TaxID=2020964 RepID=A0A2N5J7T2_9BIFI|nr:internalin [Bifidobacterium margollesii]
MTMKPVPSGTFSQVVQIRSNQYLPAAPALMPRPLGVKSRVRLPPPHLRVRFCETALPFGPWKPAVYREYNRRSGNHNWTLNKAEHDMLVRLGWKNEGVAWYTSPTGANVYRLYNPRPYHKPKHGRGNGGGEHVYTTSYGEYVSVIRAGWRGEGVA